MLEMKLSLGLKPGCSQRWASTWHAGMGRDGAGRVAPWAPDWVGLPRGLSRQEAQPQEGKGPAPDPQGAGPGLALLVGLLLQLSGALGAGTPSGRPALPLPSPGSPGLLGHRGRDPTTHH